MSRHILHRPLSYQDDHEDENEKQLSLGIRRELARVLVHDTQTLSTQGTELAVKGGGRARSHPTRRSIQNPRRRVQHGLACRVVTRTCVSLSILGHVTTQARGREGNLKRTSISTTRQLCRLFTSQCKMSPVWTVAHENFIGNKSIG